MIGRLTGKLIEKKAPFLLLDVNGVGYELQASMTTFYRLPELGEQVSLHTHLTVREDAHLLYGFFEARERKLFRTLIKVNGVGPKLALTILSSMEPDGFITCILDQDTASLVRMPGVGKKTAERLIVEMRDRLSDWQDSDTTMLTSGEAVTIAASKGPVQDAISALVALGYKQQEASRSVKQLASDDVTSEELIRLALQGMK